MSVEAMLLAMRSMPARLRAASIASLLLAIVACIAIAILTHPARDALFAAPLRAEQLAEVQEHLAQWNVPFTPTADNVVVDGSHRNEILLRLSLIGVPHQHVASTQESLAAIGALTPQAVIDAQTRSGLAGDIEIALRSLAGVDDARVIIAPATTAEFADESTRDASASVRLLLHPGAVLTRESIAGIRAFVAASVTGLDASHVTILDDRGVALGDRMGADDEADELQRSLQSALDVALGSGAAVVRVNVAYARAASEMRVVRRAPLSEVAIDRNVQSEAYTDAGKHYQKVDEHDDRGSETRETVTQSSPGELDRISTAVMVDARRGLDLASVRAIAAATVGFDPHRGDSLVVSAVDFHREPEVRRDGWFLAYGAIVPLLPTLAVIVAMLAFARRASPHVVKIATAFLERSTTARASRAVSGYTPTQVRARLAGEPPHAAAAIISALPAATAAAILELYPQHEREAIVLRMQRAKTPLAPDATEVLRDLG